MFYLKLLMITNRQKCFWRKRNILKDKDMIIGPFASTLDTGNISISEKSHIVISECSTIGDKSAKMAEKNFPRIFLI